MSEQQERRGTSFTVNEWCSQRKISPAMYYKLRQFGQAPDSYLVGGRRYISAEADARWLADREAASREAAE